MIEVWKACGMDLEHVQFKWASKEIAERGDEYWRLVLQISSLNSVARVMRCSTIMGREDSVEMPSSQVLYPVMQCADIFFLKADICQLGLDQRKVNMLARDTAEKLKPKKRKPVILSHHMLGGLKEGQLKMSKSSPDSAIFMEDEAADVRRKIKGAYCPPQIIEANPCLEYVKYIVFGKPGSTFTVSRSEENGGPSTYSSYADVEADYVSGALHPGDMKPALAAALNELIEPVRKHFKEDAKAKALLKRVRSFKVTR